MVRFGFRHYVTVRFGRDEGRLKEEKMMGYKISAMWTDDCQGKKDYDGEILSISTRYWGSRDYRSIGGELTRPSAHSQILLRHDEDNYSTLIEANFEEDTFEEVKLLVEIWGQEQMNKLVGLLKSVFDIRPNH